MASVEDLLALLEVEKHIATEMVRLVCGGKQLEKGSFIASFIETSFNLFISIPACPHYTAVDWTK